MKVKLFLGWHLLAYLLGHKDFEEAFAILDVLNVFGVNLILWWRILIGRNDVLTTNYHTLFGLRVIQILSWIVDDDQRVHLIFIVFKNEIFLPGYFSI